jgi:hypothetical protein
VHKWHCYFADASCWVVVAVAGRCWGRGHGGCGDSCWRDADDGGGVVG